MVKQSVDMQKLLDDLDACLLASREIQDATSAAWPNSPPPRPRMNWPRCARPGRLATRGQAGDLQKRIDEANATIIDLQGDKARLADKHMTSSRRTSRPVSPGSSPPGSCVVSWSTSRAAWPRKTPNTPTRPSGPIVVETVGKVMRSVGLGEVPGRGLLRFAAVLFGDGEWQTYTAKSVDDDVSTRVKPVRRHEPLRGAGTGIQARATGVDSVYVFSDGLPTSPGASLPRAAERRLEGRSSRSGDPRQASEADSGDRLEPHVRRQREGPRHWLLLQSPACGRSCGRWPARTTAVSWMSRP